MTTGNHTPEPKTAVDASASIHVVRARKLLYGGLVGGVAAALLCLIGFGLANGIRGLVSAGLAAALVLFFYGFGQFVMVLFADAGARTLMLVSMVSYVSRVALLGLVLAAYNGNRDSWPSLVPMAIFLTTVAVVVGWLAVEVYVFSRLRITSYDTDDQAPTRGGDVA